jgi:hypothetical protein
MTLSFEGAGRTYGPYPVRTSRGVVGDGELKKAPNAA